MAGRLYVVATPIGNLGDMTPRAADALREVDCVAAEDTRRTAILLKHVGARPRLVSYREENHARAARGLLDALAGGAKIALVSDAGTPAISDPGVALVREAVAAGVEVVPIPGVSAVTTVLSAAGIACGSFRFVGFLARSGRRRKDEMARIAGADEATVLFESPYRVGETLGDLATACGAGRAVCVAREVTKLHEEWMRGTLGEVAARFAAGSDKVRGEFVVVVAGGGEEREDSPRRHGVTEEKGEDRGADAVAGAETPMSDRDLIDALAAEFGVPRRVVYNIANRLRREKVSGTFSDKET